MALELLREDIQGSSIVKRETARTVVENDIIVPDSKPDIARILLSDGEIYIGSALVKKDRVAIEGKIRYNILYIADDEKISLKSIESVLPFTYDFEMAGLAEDMDCTVKSSLEHIECRIANSRKLSLKAIAVINCKVRKEKVYSIVRGIEGIDDIQINSDSYDINSYLGRADETFTISETLDIPTGKPSIGEMLRNDVRVSNAEWQTTEDKVIFKGQVTVSSLYKGEDEEESIQFMELEIPFTQLVELPGINEDSNCNLEYVITDARFTTGEDIDGEPRLLNVSVELNVKAAGYGRKELDVVSDAYSPTANVQAVSEKIRLEEMSGMQTQQAVVKEIIELNEENPEVNEIFNVVCKPVVSEYTVEDNAVTVEGAVNCNILYLSDNKEQPVNCIKHDIPFKEIIKGENIQQQQNCDFDVIVNHCSYNILSAREVELRIALDIRTNMAREIVLPVVGRMEEFPEERSQGMIPSVVIHFVRQNETLWNVAKKYRTTMEEIERFNTIGEGGMLKEGQQVIIPRKKIIS